MRLDRGDQPVHRAAVVLRSLVAIGQIKQADASNRHCAKRHDPNGALAIEKGKGDQQYTGGQRGEVIGIDGRRQEDGGERCRQHAAEEQVTAAVPRPSHSQAAVKPGHRQHDQRHHEDGVLVGEASHGRGRAQEEADEIGEPEFAPSAHREVEQPDQQRREQAENCEARRDPGDLRKVATSPILAP